MLKSMKNTQADIQALPTSTLITAIADYAKFLKLNEPYGLNPDQSRQLTTWVEEEINRRIPVPAAHG